MKIIIALFISLILAAVLFSQHEDSTSTVPTHEPSSLTILDILNASDLQEGIDNAVRTQDESLFRQWQTKAVEVAKALDLGERDIAFISGSQGAGYLRFHAQRRLFSEAFETRYYNAENIQDIKAQYPQAIALFAAADELIMQRNQTIAEAAKVLIDEQLAPAQALSIAKQQWKHVSIKGQISLEERD